jgi:hypothetical protein
VIRLPPLSPNLNADAERFVRSITDECLEKMILCGPRRCVATLASTSLAITASYIIRDWRTASSGVTHGIVAVTDE